MRRCTVPLTDVRASDAYQRLADTLRPFGSVLVAFSGGVDSSVLLQAAHEVLEGDVHAITIAYPYVQQECVDRAVYFTSLRHISHDVIVRDFPPDVRQNPYDRCYLCKRDMVRAMHNVATARGCTLVDGTNADELEEYRPGLRALEEADVKSPLAEAGLGKQDVRYLARRLAPEVAAVPSSPCLLTRLPYDTPVDDEMLARLEEAELYMRETVGVSKVRVRVHGDVARIEVAPEERHLFFSGSVMDDVDEVFRRLGFGHVALDLKGYQHGSFDDEPT